MASIKKAVILAAGLGTRFLPITKSIPKEMLPLIDKPTIHYIVEELVKSQIEQILIVVSSYKDSIIDYFDNSYELEKRLSKVNKIDELKIINSVSDLANIHYIRQKEPLGLGHAILVAEQFVDNSPFVALTGDDFIYNNENEKPAILQCIDLFNETNSTVVGVQKVSQENVNKYGIVEPLQINEKNNSILLKSVVEKPDILKAPSRYAIMGRYVLKPTIFEYLKNTPLSPKGEIELTDALIENCLHEKVYAKIFTGERFDIGTKIGFIEATIFLSLLDKKLSKNVKKILEKYVNKSAEK